MHRTASIWLTVFPIALTLGVLTIPVVADYGNHDLAVAAARLTARWYWGHLASALAFGLGGIAAVALYGVLVRYPGNPTGLWAAGLAIIGAALHVYGLGADGIGPTAVLAAGGDPVFYFEGLGLRLSGIFMAGAGAFCIGWLGLTASWTRRVAPLGDCRTTLGSLRCHTRHRERRPKSAQYKQHGLRPASPYSARHLPPRPRCVGHWRGTTSRTSPSTLRLTTEMC